MKWTTAFFASASLAMASELVEREPEFDLLDKRTQNIIIAGGRSKEIIVIWANPGAGSATTTINQRVTVTQTVTVGAATNIGGSSLTGGQTATLVQPPGASHTVKVGGPGGLVFQPQELDVPVGDTVIFEFLSQNHTVTQSAFAKPCAKIDNGMDTGFVPNPNNTVSPAPQVAMQVTVKTPLWFYCRQKGHCGKGMVFSINPTAEKTHAMFQQMAIQQNGSGQPSPITGGQPGAPPANQPAAPAQSSPAAGEGQGGNGGNGVTPGQGTVGPDGSCQCSVQCAPGAFPAMDAQGVGAMGGSSGALPVNAAIR